MCLLSRPPTGHCGSARPQPTQTQDGSLRRHYPTEFCLFCVSLSRRLRGQRSSVGACEMARGRGKSRGRIHIYLLNVFPLYLPSPFSSRQSVCQSAPLFSLSPFSLLPFDEISVMSNWVTSKINLDLNNMYKPTPTVTVWLNYSVS